MKYRALKEIYRKRTHVLAAVLLFLFAGSILPSILKKKKEEPQKKRPCCVLGVSTKINDAKVILEQICSRSDSMVIYFRTANMPGTCTHPPGTFLIDQNGRRYSMKSFTGMPQCSSGTTNPDPEIRFTWSFEKFGADVKKFSLEERPTEVTAGMAFWIWKDINISHCSF